MKHSKRKKKRPSQPKQGNKSFIGNANEGTEERKVINSLVEAFSLTSIEDARTAYKEADGDSNEAAEILSGLWDNSETQGLCSSSCGSSGLGSSSYEGSTDSNGSKDSDVNRREFRGNKGKKVVAATGTVSTLLGKNYVTASPRKELIPRKGLSNVKVKIEEAEQFLCSMMGDDCDINMAVVRDVLCQCGYDAEKALDVLLDLSATSFEPSGNDRYSAYIRGSGDDTRYFSCSDNLMDRGSDSASHSSESDTLDYVHMADYGCRNYSEALIGSDSSTGTSVGVYKESEIPQMVLESLFSVPKSSAHEPSTMNWRNVVRKMETFAQKRYELCPDSSGPQQYTYEKGAEYKVFREGARHHWDSMKTSYQKAAMAYSKGGKDYAAYLSDQGKLKSTMAQREDEKASMEIFTARNRGIENFLTIDLHGQHVKQAIRLVKLHLLFATYISSVQFLRIITGCGTHGIGKSKLKQSVINLLDKEGVKWREENRGTVLVKLDGPREFSFLDADSDSE